MTSDAGAAPVGTRCYNRIEAGSRRFPIILDLIRKGAVSLTAVRLLQPAATWPAGGPGERDTYRRMSNEPCGSVMVVAARLSATRGVAQRPVFSNTTMSCHSRRVVRHR
jgi:hypothetical protein